ncbi:glucose-1-phosphate adenylyltransferase subunit GlgD [Clostridium sp.]|uniref:glucose-1-phosphate adenylyltransferase subunit GlgD n=1 Tax=Clostridium sp. TaxID=1506 RepID=UPI003F2E3B99
MDSCLGIINLDEKENNMGHLVKNRLLATVPIAGRYKVIDFILSNMTNSGISEIGIFTKNSAASLINYLSNGKAWDLDRKRDGLRVFNFGNNDLMYDDVHNFIENIEFFEKSNSEYVLLAPSYMVCNIDYSNVIKHHKREDNDITVVYKNISKDEDNFINCKTIGFDKNYRAREFSDENKFYNVNMEMYCMRKDVFVNIIHHCVLSGLYKKVTTFIEENLKLMKVGGYEFKGYLACINSVETYFKSNMKMLDRDINEELFHSEKQIYTREQNEPFSKYTECSDVRNSIVANGSYIEGNIQNCVIGKKVYIGKGVKLRNCIILRDSVIRDGVILDSVIVEKDIDINNGYKLIKNNKIPIIVSS